MRVNEVEGGQAEISILDWSFWEMGKQVACQEGLVCATVAVAILLAFA